MVVDLIKKKKLKLKNTNETNKKQQMTPGGWVIAFSFWCLEFEAALCSVETGKQYHDCANLLLPNFFIFIYIGI